MSSKDQGTSQNHKNSGEEFLEEKIDLSDLDRLRELIKKLDSEENHNGCLILCEKVLKTFDLVEFLILRAKYEILLGIFVDANETLKKVLEKDPKNAEATAMLAFNFYHQGKLLSALQTYQSALTMKPEMIEAENNRMKAQKLWDVFATVPSENAPDTAFSDALVSNLADALLIDPRNKRLSKVLHYLHGFANYRLNLFLPAIDSLTKAIDLDYTNFKVFFLRAKCYLAAASYENAIIDLKEVEKFPKSISVSAEIKNMRREAGKNFREQSHYAILEVDRDASDEAIHLSFQSFQLLYQNKIDNAKSESEKRKYEFKLGKVEAAFRVLEHREARIQYDKILDTQETVIECFPISTCCSRCGNFCGGLRNGFSSCSERSCSAISKFFANIWYFCRYCFFTCLGHSCSAFGRCLEKFCLNPDAALCISTLILFGIFAGSFYLIFYFIRFLFELISSLF